MFKRFPLTSRFLLFLVAPAVLVCVAAFLHFRQSLPFGESLNAAVRGRVSIERDSRGVPYVKASSDEDAFFAIGLLHAQDRLWQLELQRRVAAGRLSEILGERTVAQDAMMRNLGLYASARSAWDSLDAGAKQSLTSYAAGVNAWMSTQKVLPPEFALLDVKPEPWTELDSLAWAKVFALNLSVNMNSEISAALARERLTESQIADLYDAPSAATALTDAQGGLQQLLAIQQDLREIWKIGLPYTGSNAWAVSARCSASGAAMLANDTHMGLQIPSVWYVASIRGSKLNVTGMTLVGLPLVVFGRNQQIAWGGTNMMADTQDLYLIETNPLNPMQYRYGSAWLDFAIRTEKIDVKAPFPSVLRARRDPVELTIRSSTMGPVVSTATGLIDHVVALRWTALDPSDTSYQAFFDLNYARDWSSFSQALHKLVAPAMNIIYADTAGHIGHLAAGRVPIRNHGDGRLPAPGSSDEFQWKGYIPPDQLPQSFDPEDCYVASANDRNAGKDYPFFLSSNWAPPARGARIREMLAKARQEHAGISLEDMMKIQGDTIDLGTRSMRELMLATTPRNDEGREVLKVLRDWDGNMARDSAAAAIYLVWSRHLREQLLANVPMLWDRPTQYQQVRSYVNGADDDHIERAYRSGAWCDRQAGKAPSCSELIEAALTAAMDELRRLRGSDLDDWTLGAVQSTNYEHVPFTNDSALSALFARRVPNGGSAGTVNLSVSRFRDGVGYEQTTGPAFRQIIDMRPQDPLHMYMNTTGQSGNPLSRHYSDMVTPFRDVLYFQLPSADGEDADRAHLELVPQQARK